MRSLGLARPRPAPFQGYTTLTGSSGSYISTPDTSGFTDTGDLTVDVKVALNDWTPASTVALASHWGDQALNQWAWLFHVNTSGNLQMVFSQDGANVGAVAVSSAATGVADGAVKWCRLERPSVSGDVTFYLSDTGDIFTQLGTTQVTGSPGALFDSTMDLELGANFNGTGDQAAGKFYGARFWSGLVSQGTGVLKRQFDGSNGPGVISVTGEIWTAH